MTARAACIIKEKMKICYDQCLIQWHRSRQSNEMTSLLILLPAVLLGTGRFLFQNRSRELLRPLAIAA